MFPLRLHLFFVSGIDASSRLVRRGQLWTWRDQPIARLMLYCGLRSCKVVALIVADVDIGGLQVAGKVNRER